LIDYTPRYPDTVFATAVWYFRPILDAAVADAKAAAKGGKDYTKFSSMKEGGNDIVYTAAGLSPDAVTRMEAKRKEMKAGAFVVPLDPSEPT